MPTRKQRRRAAKEKRHEYETVWVDADGNELDEPPEEALAEQESGRDGKADEKPAAKGKSQTQRGGTRGRTPPEPSWQRAGRRAGLLGIVVFALFYLTGKGSTRILSALALAAVYTALFIPFTYAIDRFAYQRYVRKTEGGSGRSGGKQPPKKKR
jgi:hypothetical protein